MRRFKMKYKFIILLTFLFIKVSNAQLNYLPAAIPGHRL